MKKKYPKSPCNNPTCRGCHWFGRKSITCDYFLKTGKRKEGCGETCTAYRPIDKEEKRKDWLYGGKKDDANP